MVRFTYITVIKKILFCLTSGSLIIISLLCGYKLWHNVLATPWTPITPPTTGPETPPGVIFTPPSPQLSSGTYHSSLSPRIAVDPNTFHTFYTLDGTDPDGLSTEYTDPINIPYVEGSVVRLKAIAYDGTGKASDVSEANYVFNNTTPISVDSSNLSDLNKTGVFTIVSDGSTAPPATQVNVQTVITIPSSVGSTSSVVLPKDLQIVRTDGALFDSSALTSGNADSIVSGLSNETVLRGAIQWGIVDHGLAFSSPITININVGSDLDGQTLNVTRSTDGTTGWTNDGIVNPATCTVANGICQFQANKASFYVATSASTSNNNNNNNNNNSQSNSSPSSNNGPPGCNDRTPLFIPDLFKIITTKGTAKIVFTPVTDNITGYVVTYGLKKGDERFAALFNSINNNQGEQNFTINKLNPRNTYYFKVAAQNGCVSGPASDWIPAKANTKKEIHKYITVVKNKIKTLVNQFK